MIPTTPHKQVLFQEYPKRVYVGEQGYTVNNAEEEAAFNKKHNKTVPADPAPAAETSAKSKAKKK